jgi:hypothetical protein
MVKVQLAMPTQVWRATASADATSYVLDGTASYDLTSAQLVNVADTTGGSLQIVALGDSNTDVYIQFASCFFA